MRWTIFCRVIDNYGDAGVCWRLATDLAQRGEWVTLFIDEPDVLSGLIDADASPSTVLVKPWPKNSQCFAASEISDVVIEAFACDPPAAYIAAMAQRAEAHKAPVWINLEYLSAEEWVGSHHGLPSPNPRYPLIKHFYFPGFTPDSGGLLREADAIQSPDEGEAGFELSQPLRLFLFGYEQPALTAWIATLHHTVLSVAPCPAAKQVTANIASKPSTLTLQYVDFVPQAKFDDILKKHDLLFVRGEDSFVRAQWAGKPVFWQIYPQDDGAHLTKLRAFYKRYLDTGTLSETEHDVFLRFLLAWNGVGNPNDCATLWPEIVQMLPALQKNALVWRAILLKQPDLVTQLRAFVADLVK